MDGGDIFFMTTFVLLIGCGIGYVITDSLRQKAKKKARALRTLLTGEVFCVDCKSYVHDKELGSSFSKCRRTKKKEEEKTADYLVSGNRQKPEYKYSYCDWERNKADESCCGASGKHYVAKV